MRFLKVVVGLQTQPEALAGTQRQRHADSGVRGNAALAEDDFVDPERRDAHRARQRVLADAERDEELLKPEFTGMDLGEGGHRSSHAVSVGIADLHVVRIAVAPAEADTLLSVDQDRAYNRARRNSLLRFPPIKMSNAYLWDDI